MARRSALGVYTATPLARARTWSGEPGTIKLAEISPIEHSVMWIGTYEFKHCTDVPWRVVLNECIELAKGFGGTDGHKYVNGVLNGLAPQLRPQEVAQDVGKTKSKTP